MFARFRWPRAPRTIQASFRALRKPGPALWPEPPKKCKDVRPLPAELEALPGKIQCAVKDGVITAFRAAPPINVSASPHEAAPFRSKPLNETFIVIVGSTEAACIFSMLELYGAIQGAAATAVPVVFAFPASGADLLDFLSFFPHAYERVHLSSVEIVPSSLDAYHYLEFTVQKGGGETVIDRVGPEGLEDLSVDVAPETEVSISVANRDPLSAFLLYVTVRGWRYTVQGAGDFLSSALLIEDGEYSDPQTACIPDADGHGGCS